MQKHPRICYARDGAGNFSLPYPDFVTGTTIESAQVDANNSDVATALTASIAKDGQTVPTANLPMGGFKHTGVAAASALTHYARADQVVGSVLDYAIDTGTATAYAIAPTPGIAAYVVGQRFAFKATNANSGADPTLAVNSLPGGIIYWPNGASLIADEIPASGQVVVQVATVTTGTPTFHLQSATKPPLPRTGGTLTGATTAAATFTMSAAAFNGAVRVDVASDTTCDIGAAASNYVRITGTNTITGLGTVASGVEREVVFGGALILTHNGTSLILHGGQNILTVAGDTATFVSEGSGNWRCTKYIRAGVSGVLQRVITTSGSYSSNAATIPIDNTKPQSGEGTELLTQAITPKSATSKLVVEVTLVMSCNTAPDTAAIALFQDSGTDAIAANCCSVDGYGDPKTLRYEVTSGSTTARTFKVRAGCNTNALLINGVNGVGAVMNGLCQSFISVTEYGP